MQKNRLTIFSATCNFMKKNILLIGILLMMASCKTEQQIAMTSADKNFILKVANEKFEKKKWQDALALYERLSNLVAGTDDAPNVVFNSAYANYYDKNYKLAGYQFKNFAVSFPQDPRREEAAYFSALCYYQGSLDYNLDQTSTESAINELQEFLNSYPNSERAKNIDQMIDELTYKLELKAYENARQYYKMGEYKAANIAFDNVLNDFPSTKLRPKIYDYIMKSRYELATNSVFDLKRDRLESALAFTKQIEKELPSTDYSKTALDLRTKLQKEKENFAKVEKEVEAQKAEFKKKQQEFEAKEAEKNQIEAEKSAEAGRRDSARINTPAPAATINIK